MDEEILHSTDINIIKLLLDQNIGAILVWEK